MGLRGDKMINIRPVSDLRYKFSEIENLVKEGSPVYLTKNGYGSMVVMSIDAYSRLIHYTEDALDEADHYAKTTTRRMSHEEVFSGLRRQLND